MSDERSTMPRRAVLQTAAGLAAGHIAVTAGVASAADMAGTGRIGDFNFLAGEWRIKHRRLKKEGTSDWDVFEGEATCWTILNGVASIEELRIPSRDFSGMGVRVLDLTKKVWSDFWVNGKFGVLAPPGLTGVFRNGAGVFEADDMDGDKSIKVRGVWDRITPTSCRWHQAVSRDGGRTWAENWVMEWARVK